MKSSSEGISDLLKNYFRILYRPTEVIGDLSSRPVNLANTLIMVIISGVLLVSGVFLAGDAIYTTFHEYAFTYPLEMLTSGQLFGFYLPYMNVNYYGLVFLSDILFVLKSYIFLTILLYGFLKVFKQKISIKRTSQLIAWSIFPLGIVMFIASLICMGLKFIVPGIYHFIYFGVLAVGFIVIAPVIIYLFLERLKDVSVYKSISMYYLSLFVVFLIFTINHAGKFLVLIW